jgi:LacI family transcriptional regulator
VKPRQKRIALIGLPVFQSINNLTCVAIARHAEETGRWRFVFSAEASVAAFKFLRTLDCDGAIVRITSEAMKREARKIRFPLVNVSSWLADPGVPSAKHDYRALGRMAAEHLLEKGFRRIGCVIVPGGNFIQERFMAFSETLKLRGLKPQLFHLRTTQPALQQPVSAEEKRRFANWVRTLQPPAALALMDDWDAPTLMNSCREAGLEIPRDLVVITACSHSEVVPQCPVPLSAPLENHELLGRLAVACLDDLMSGKRLENYTITVPPMGMAERTSTATMAIEDREVAHAVEFIRAHGFEPINISDVLTRVSISRVTLERRFRQVIGETPHEYLIQHRVRRAQELLLQQPPPSLQAIAKQSGLPDRRRLNQVFSRVTGKTPAVWRDWAIKHRGKV